MKEKRICKRWNCSGEKKKLNYKSCTTLMIQVIGWCQQTKEGASFWHNFFCNLCFYYPWNVAKCVLRKKNIYSGKKKKIIMKKERILLLYAFFFHKNPHNAFFFHNTSTSFKVFAFFLTKRLFSNPHCASIFYTRAKLLKLEDEI